MGAANKSFAAVDGAQGLKVERASPKFDAEASLEKSPARYVERPWPTIRNAIVTLLNHARPHPIAAAIEIDATDAIEALRRLQRELRAPLSFHAFLIFCLARAMHENEAVRTYRYGSRRLIAFEDVDILTAVDKRLPSGVRIPVGHIVRAAQTKSLAEIFLELRAVAKAADLEHDPAVRKRRRFAAMPAPIRRWFAWRMTRNPFLLKEVHGVAGLTSIQAQGLRFAGFPITPTIHTLSVAVGSLCERLQLSEQGKLERRKILCATITVDHDVIDGMPAARFGQRFHDLIAAATGLDEACAGELRARLRANREGD